MSEVLIDFISNLLELHYLHSSRCRCGRFFQSPIHHRQHLAQVLITELRLNE